MTASRLVELLYLMLPAYAANMAPLFLKFWPGWNRPINRALLGEHKTVLGFTLGVLVGILAAYIQSLINWSSSLWSSSLLTPANWFALGLAEGFGAMAGDSIKSFFKRRVGIAPGESWMLADQLDFVIGALVLLMPMIRLDWIEIAVILVISFVGDNVVNYLSFLLGIRATKL